MEPHKEGLSEIIPLRKHLLRHQGFKAQIGMMEGNTFCTSLQPRLFTIGNIVIIFRYLNDSWFNFNFIRSSYIYYFTVLNIFKPNQDNNDKF